MDGDYDLIRRISTTTASVHDSQVDLSETRDIVYRDRGYQGAKCKGCNATMKRGARDHLIGIRDKLRNERITRKRSKGERPFAVMKTVFQSGTMKVPERGRARVKNTFTAFCYILYQLRTIQKQRA